MLRYYCFVVFLSCVLVEGASQQKYADSLRQVYLQEKDPFKKIDVFYEIANELSQDNPALGFAYADSLEQMARKASYKKGLAMSKHLRGFAHDDNGEYEKALKLFQEELAIFIEINDRKELSTAYTNLGSVWGNMGQKDSSIAYYLKSLTMDEETGDSLGMSINHNNIGNIYSDDGAYEKAIHHFEKALKIRQQMGAEKRYLQCYSNLATVYSRKKDYKKSEEYAIKGLEYAIKYDNKSWAGIITNSLGATFNDQNRFREAIPWLEKAVGYWTAIGNEAYLTYAFYNLTISYAGLKDGSKALQYADRGYAIVEKLQLEHQRELYYKAFAQANEASGNMAAAYDWYKKYVTLADSIFKLDNTKKVAQIEAQFQTQKREAQLAQQQLQIEREAAQKKTILFAAAAVILALGAGFYYLRNKQRLRQKETEIAAEKAALDARLEHAEAEKLREMDALKSTFFANISHEFRTPLTLIISPVEQMMNGTFQGDFQKYYRIIHRNGKRLLDLVNQLMDLSKLESGKLKLEASEGDLGRFVGAIAGSFESLAVRQQVDFVINIPEEPAVCFFDRDKVEKMLVNLVSNAFKFTGEGGKVQVELLPPSANSTSSAVSTLVIKDTGIGIPQEQLPHLFERFTKSSLSEVQAGSGIGLALVKELAELHGGSIEVQSEDGKGSTFTVTLAVGKEFFENGEIVAAVTPPAPPQGGLESPGTQGAFIEAPNLRQSNASAPVEEVHSPFLPREKTSTTEQPVPAFENQSLKSSSAQPPLRGGRGGDHPIFPSTNKPLLLLAEDNPDVRSYIAGTLAGDYKIIEAENGKLALEKALETTPDLVITDLMMPEMDGTELCKQLKTSEKTSHIPVVMLTARAEQSDKLAGLQTGADDYLVKPFDARELLVRVANLISQRKNLQEHYRRSLTAFSPAPVTAESMDAVFLQKVRDAVEANLDDENFSVVELGNQTGMSRSQLHRKLSALTGFSPNEVIRNMRLERAKQLLEKKSGTVSEIAYLCGFNSPAYFIKCFKDYFGKTPGEV